MDMGLEGRACVVTGASRGIGLAVAQAFAHEGAHVVAGARHPGKPLEELADSHGLVPVAGDLTTVEGVERLVETAKDRFGGIDVLVNNVGIVHLRPNGFLSVTDEDFAKTLDANFFSAVRACRAALPALLAARGTIVTISSVNAFYPDPGLIDYTVSKAALTNFSKALSKEVGPQGVRVNTVAPGPVSTDMWLGESGLASQAGSAMGVDPDTAREKLVEGTGGFATGRFTRPDEVADLVLLLASDRAGNITGTDVTIDGGLIKTL
jgi:NAD(P)-dependent dehydrogenase (short-subunit alcohol dehydrogenase family)